METREGGANNTGKFRRAVRKDAREQRKEGQEDWCRFGGGGMLRTRSRTAGTAGVLLFFSPTTCRASYIAVLTDTYARTRCGKGEQQAGMERGHTTRVISIFSETQLPCHAENAVTSSSPVKTGHDMPCFREKKQQ